MTQKKSKLNKANLLDIIEKSKHSLNRKAISDLLKIDRSQKGELKSLLKDLLFEKKIIKSRSRRYISSKKEFELVIGSLDLNKYGFGFVIPQDGSQDIYVNGNLLNGAFHKDTVEVKLIDRTHRNKNREGSIKRIIERGLSTLICRYNRGKKESYFIPIDSNVDLKIYPKGIHHKKDLKTGDICSTRLFWKSFERGKIDAEIVKNFKSFEDAKDDNLFVILKNKVNEEFSPKALKEAQNIVESPELSKGKKDLRHLHFITIDPVDAKDFDDAIYAEKTKSGYCAYIAIADVSAYVKTGSALDNEAYKRCNSFYFPGYVVPMLPKEISNDLCSLKGGKDRLCLTSKINLSPSFSVTSIEIFESIIHNHKRTDYKTVRKLIDKDGEHSFSPEIVRVITLMHEISQGLAKKRLTGGGIDFDLAEAQYVLDKNGQLIDIKRKQRSKSTTIVEEFMLLSNKCISEFLAKKGIEQIFRTHEEPDVDRLKDFYSKARDMGLIRASSKIKSSSDLNKFISNIKDQAKSRTLNYLLLRSMKQAKYTTTNTGHFGLGFDYYTHFTSPIRRYSDLVIHRLIKQVLRDKKTALPDTNRLESIAKNCCKMERLANECERDIFKIKSARFMEGKIGKIFQGYITSKLKSGFFIELKDHMIEGFCPLENIKIRKAPKKQFRGQKRLPFSHEVGDFVKVKVESVVIEELLIEFSIL